jgi:succinate dehydrogenase / fumarate reductase, flavoprotein subunit
MRRGGSTISSPVLPDDAGARLEHLRKGYQWPFHATRMLDFGSSLIDLAIARESAAGRRVFMDFNRDPLPVPGDLPFSLDRLDADVRAYLGAAGATSRAPSTGCAT